MEHIQNATLAGRVAVGAVVDMVLTPGDAIMTGTVAGAIAISTLGFAFLTPFLQSTLKISDTYDQFNEAGAEPGQSMRSSP